ncbi:MAG TPA: hypothetical protein VIM61_16595 [Chthoniobacterales bacterium]|jgi:hypothetical protein
MATDFIPQSYANLSDWLANLAAKLPTNAPALGLDPAELTTLQAEITALQTPLADLLAKQIALDAALGAFQQSQGDHLPRIRAAIRHLKTSPGYTAGIGEDLQVIGGGDSFDPETYKPTLSAEAFPSYVRLKGKKSGVQAMNLYVRLKGAAEWKLLVARRSKFPFEDDSPLSVAGTPETREYRAVGVVDDEEIGQSSDIVSVVYGG